MSFLPLGGASSYGMSASNFANTIGKSSSSFSFSDAFDSAMNWLKSDGGQQVAGAVAGAAGSYLAQSELQKQQQKNTLEQMNLQQQQKIDFSNYEQDQKNKLTQWADTSNLAGFDYNIGADRNTLAGKGKLSGGVLNRMRG